MSTLNIKPGCLVKLNMIRFFRTDLTEPSSPNWTVHETEEIDSWAEDIGLVLSRDRFAICQVHWLNPDHRGLDRGKMWSMVMAMIDHRYLYRCRNHRIGADELILI